ncbi:MAG TPA: hypothetical protein DD417_20470 [Elusimicrobia bacterium]|nr:hypothetical protein [Elusimicrobiota bacterium]
MLAGAGAGWAADSANLQFTVPAPNPVQAGETLSLQALAINIGDTDWEIGTYYWAAEIYDLEENLVAKTEQRSPQERVAHGAVAAISLPFHVPDTMVGRRLYRIYLIKDNKQLLASELKPFRVLEKAIPEAPKAQDYRIEGNVTVSLKDSSRDKWKRPSGATTFNAVGKIKESSYLLNAYILHEPGKVFDPFIILMTYYAPWGTIYGGDISPALSEMSVNGQGMRGGMLEQKRGGWDWAILGGQTVESQPGTLTTNGRFARTLYGGKLGRQVVASVKTQLNYFLSADEVGSLSNDPKSPRYRGPTLAAQKNRGYGLGLSWEPVNKLKFLADYQKNDYDPGTAAGPASDTAYKVEARWERPLFKVKTYVQRAGPKFVAFGAPAIVGDRMTQYGALDLFPFAWYTLSLSLNQYQDNLDSDPNKLTTNQRLISTGHSFQFKTGTSLSLNYSMNTAKGKPATVLDNQSTTMGTGVSQSFGRHSAGLTYQLSSFKDKNGLADDLDTNTISFTSNFYMGDKNASFGVTQSQTKNKRDGSARSSLSVSPSLSMRLREPWTAQLWGAMTQSKNTSPTYPADTQMVSLNSEFTYTESKVTNWTLGLGVNKFDDKVAAAASYTEVVLSARYSYSF